MLQALRVQQVAHPQQLVLIACARHTSRGPLGSTAMGGRPNGMPYKSVTRILLLLSLLGNFVLLCILATTGISSSDNAFARPMQQTFLELATATGTDKVSDHSYDNAYARYLEPLRHKAIKFFEIGLGCDMQYGPGRSVHLWQKFFTHPRTEIWEAEVDSACAGRWNHALKGRVITGDQANYTDLASWVQISAGDFDIIIDDGGHNFTQQLNSLMYLFKYALKPGGMYFMEDLLTSINVNYADAPESPVDKIAIWTKQLMLGDAPNSSSVDIENLQSIDCFLGLCVFHKCPDESLTSHCP